MQPERLRLALAWELGANGAINALQEYVVSVPSRRTEKGAMTRESNPSRRREFSFQAALSMLSDHRIIVDPLLTATDTPNDAAELFDCSYNRKPRHINAFLNP